MDATTPPCSHCQELERQLKELTAEVALLHSKLAAATKNSTNSSKPPSSDIVKPPRPPSASGTGKRHKGGQRGHARHERPAFSDDEVDVVHEYTLTHCPDCGGAVERRRLAPRILQQVELVERPLEIHEHRGLPYWCRHCQKTHYAAIDAAVRRAGLVGPYLTGVIAYLKGGCHCSFSTIRKFVRDVVGVSISRGQLARLCAKVSTSLEKTYAELLEQLPQQERLNVDETGHKDNGQPMWTWCFRAPLFTLFKIAPTRGSVVLVEVLGTEFNGVLGCDYFSAYRKYMGDFNVLVQFCLAHLLRDIKFLSEHPDRRNRVYGQRLLAAARELFGVIHRRELLAPERFAIALEDAAGALAGLAILNVPRTSEARNLAERFHQHGESYLRFLTTPGVEPTNNLAEQAIRFVVLDRLVTQGTRSETGQRWSERIWTVMATCAQQGRSVFQFLTEAISAHLTGVPPPSLLPTGQ
jgi:transposase